MLISYYIIMDCLRNFYISKGMRFFIMYFLTYYWIVLEIYRANVNDVYFVTMFLKRKTVPSKIVEVYFLNNPNESRNESTRWQTTHTIDVMGRRVRRNCSSFVEGSSASKLRGRLAWPDEKQVPRLVLKFVAVVKIKLGLDPTSATISDLFWSRFFLEVAADDISH